MNIKKIMTDIKFANQETIYLNLIDGMTGQFFKNFPNIFFPKFKLDKMSLEIYQKFIDYFLEMVMLNNAAFSIFDLSENTSEKIESMYKKYVSETKQDLRDFYDPDSKEVYTVKINNPKNEKKKKDSKLIFPNFGHEKYINTFSTSDRHRAFEPLESMSKIVEKMENRIIAQLFIFFEGILKDISENTQSPTEDYDKKLQYDEKRELIQKQFREDKKKIDEIHPNLPTFKKFAMMIDQNCHIGMDRGMSKFLRDSKYKNFNDTRNKIIHNDEFENKQPITDFFHLIKEMLDFIYNQEEIIIKMDKVYNELYIEVVNPKDYI